MKRRIVILLLAICLFMTVGNGSAIAQAQVDLDNRALCEQVKPGPPPTFFCTNTARYYKPYNERLQADNVAAMWRRADDLLIPIPRYGVSQVTYNQRNQWAFWSNRVPGTLFKLQGQPRAPINNWVDNQRSRADLERARNIFTAVRDNLGDAQGMVEPERQGVYLRFIDINTPGRSANADEVIARINNRLNKM